MTRSRHDLLAWLLVLLPMGCSDVAPTNPYDPEAPAHQQAPGTVRGRLRATVSLPPGFDEPDRLGRVAVELRPLEGDEVLRSASPGANGRCILDDVPLGSGRLVASLEGFVPVSRFVDVGPGESVDAGLLALTLPATRGLEPTELTGTAYLGGVLVEDGHGGILVEALGTPFATVTTTHGRFRLPVLPEPQTLSFSKPGFGTTSRAVASVPVGQTTELPGEVTLPARPGAVRGVIELDRFGDSDLRLNSDARIPVSSTCATNLTPRRPWRCRAQSPCAGVQSTGACV